MGHKIQKSERIIISSEARDLKREPVSPIIVSDRLRKKVRSTNYLEQSESLRKNVGSINFLKRSKRLKKSGPLIVSSEATG